MSPVGRGNFGYKARALEHFAKNSRSGRKGRGTADSIRTSSLQNPIQVSVTKGSSSFSLGNGFKKTNSIVVRAADLHLKIPKTIKTAPYFLARPPSLHKGNMTKGHRKKSQENSKAEETPSSAEGLKAFAAGSVAPAGKGKGELTQFKAKYGLKNETFKALSGIWYGRPHLPHAGQIVELYRSHPDRKTWNDLLGKHFAGSKEVFWKALDALAVHADLAKLSWLHGSNSASLALIPRTDGSLWPLGRLMNSGLVPFSGELTWGVIEGGIGKREISGVAAELVSYALKYAHNRPILHAGQYNFEMGQSKNQILNHLGKLGGDQFHPKEHLTVMDLGIIRLHIRRLRLWDSRRFEEAFPTIRGDLQSLIEKQPELKQEIEKILLEINLPIKSPLSETERSLIQEAFPVVYASTTLPLRFIFRDGELVEYGASLTTDFHTGKPTSEAALGKDLQYLFVPGEKISTVDQWLKGSGYGGRVLVLDIALLELLQVIMKRHSDFKYYDRELGHSEPFTKLFSQIQEYAHDSHVVRH